MRKLVRVGTRTLDPAEYRRGFGVLGILIQLLFWAFCLLERWLEACLLRAISRDENIRLDQLIESLQSRQKIQVYRRAATTIADDAVAEAVPPAATRADKYREGSMAGEDPAKSPAFARSLAVGGRGMVPRESRYAGARKALYFAEDEEE